MKRIIALCGAGWLSACVQIPTEPLEDLQALAPDGSVEFELSIDAGAARPPTEAPYTGPECDPVAAGTGTDPHADGAAGDGGDGEPDPDLAEAAGEGTGGGEDGAPPRPGLAGEVVISELMVDPVALSDTAGEWIELYNPGATALSLSGCALLDSGRARPIDAPLTLPAGGHVVIARGEMPGVSPDAVVSLILSNSGDSVGLQCDGVTIDEVTYGEGFPITAGASLSLSATALDAKLNDLPEAWCAAVDSFGGDRGTPGAPNPPCEPDDADAGVP
ncbi:MAG: lamin tail domain-containing protein [Myxococcales bacterium]|jgi:hypothetical protein